MARTDSRSRASSLPWKCVKTRDKKNRSTSQAVEESYANVEVVKRNSNSPKTEYVVNCVVWVLAVLSSLHLLLLLGLMLLTKGFHSEISVKNLFYSVDSLALFSEPREGREVTLMMTNAHNDKEKKEQLKRIPRIIHQTFKTDNLSPKQQNWIRTWRINNPSWSYRFYNDSSCLQFVQMEFPQYFDAYIALPKNVERADFFRYLVTLHYGGIYADLDTECMFPIDDIIQPSDSLIVGWESDAHDLASKRYRNLARNRQILQWIFAATPQHPVLREICESIAMNALTVYTNYSNMNTLEKTGPGRWTDIVLKHAKDDTSIRIMPRVSFGTHFSGLDGVPQSSRAVIVKHHFAGSWKEDRGKKKCLLPTPFCKIVDQSTEPIDQNPTSHLYPVSANFTNPFSIYVYRRSFGPFVADSDVSFELSLRGHWQAGNKDPDMPRVVDVIAGSLTSNVNKNLQFLDIGAGLGFFSLAVASQHHSVIAFENNMLSVNAFQVSIEKNHFQDDVLLLSSVDDMLNALDRDRAQQQIRNQDRGKDSSWTNIRNTHFITTTTNSSCEKEIGAIRIGYSGWSSICQALNGTSLLRKWQPDIILLEFSPGILKYSGCDKPLDFLHDLVSLGYSEAYHAGKLCERRWEMLSSRFSNNVDKHPNWCTVVSTEFDLFSEINENLKTPPENILLVKRKNANQT